MSDDDGGSSFNKFPNSVLNELLGVGIKRGGGFIEDENGRVLEDGSSNRKSLLLTSRKFDTSFANFGLIFFG